jgi:hypothetical protein
MIVRLVPERISDLLHLRSEHRREVFQLMHDSRFTRRNREE